MYKRDKKDPMKEHVEKALKDYRADSYNITAGYSILRYAADNLLCICTDVSASVFFDWYPSNPGFVILRLAKEGSLIYRTRIG